MRRPLALVALFVAVACTAPEAPPSAAKASASAPASTAAEPPERPSPAPEVPPGPSEENFARGDQESVRAALATAWGRVVDDDTCIEWPESFPRLVVVGSFAHDRGCRLHGVFIDRRYVEKDYVPAGLATRGFANASPSLKPGIAKAWVEQVAHAFEGRFVTEPTPAFAIEGSPAFTLVKVSGATADITVEGWVREPSGRRDEEAYEFVSYRFTPEGALTTTRSQRFAVDGARLRALTGEPTTPPTSPTPTSTRTAVDMKKFDLSCKVDRDCTHVRPSPCGACGCANVPLAQRDMDRFREAIAEIQCPPPVDRGISCGGCPGYLPHCERGKCAVKTH